MSKNGQDIKNMLYKANFLKEDTPSVAAGVAAELKKKNDNLDMFLENDRENIKKETWSRLDKTIKIQKLEEYVDSIVEKYNLSEDEITNLKKYLFCSIDKKRLLSVKDVFYDKNTNKIKTIPCLQFNTTTRMYTLKRCEKRLSTIKSLGVGKKKVVVIQEGEE